MPIDRPSPRGLAPAVIAAAGVLALLTACASGGDVTAGLTGPADAPAASPTQGPGASFNEADVTFTQMMIEHHRQAVEMAGLARTRSQDPEIKKLAAAIDKSQGAEITTMTGWLARWGKPATPSGGMQGHDMPGMMTGEDMKRLDAARGREFDRMFLRMMITHHQGAIAMAETERARGSDPQAKELATTIEATQRAEIKRMRKLLARR
ncbi:DUF305 domain-containing protein [Streptosporangium oxazolinicum]|uniref:DUF305 domain-containing protein n=1 Tax=Streptosporangium oxazolinicum TaxID=909287 RepID=A0ABP8AWY1_9ACTN